MTFETILVEKTGFTTIITLNRPGKLNALNAQMMGELTHVMVDLRQDTETRFVILRGAGKAFTAGADLSARGAPSPPQTAGAEAQRSRLSQLAAHDLIRAYENLEQVTIAAVHGYCLGGGLVFAIASDFILATEDAVLGVPEANVGMFYSWGATARLNRLVGPLWTRQMVMTCQNITAAQALSIGLVNQVVPNQKLMEAAWQLVDNIASKPTLAIRLTKKLVNAYSEPSRGDLFALESELMEYTNYTSAPAEGARAFREKREPKFGAR